MEGLLERLLLGLSRVVTVLLIESHTAWYLGVSECECVFLVILTGVRKDFLCFPEMTDRGESILLFVCAGSLCTCPMFCRSPLLWRW